MTLLDSSEDKLVATVCPVSVKNSKLLQQDDQGNSIVTDLDELSASSEININPSSINIENSTDVIIGPVTQFHGPVTIYQNVKEKPAIENISDTDNALETYQNGKLVKSESQSSDASHPTEKPQRNFLSQSNHLRYIGIALLIVVIISIITSCAVILSSKSKPSSKPTVQPTTSTIQTDTDDGTNLEPIRPGSRIPRELWHGHKPKNFTKPLHHPVPFVIISHSVTPFCNTFNQCYRRVRSIQEYHMNELGSPDIGYNFLIGGDANVYVGRGWDVRNFHSADSIGISFIGDYTSDHLTEDMVSSTKALLKEGVENGILTVDYKLVGHNQTFSTQSPGRNAYSVIKTWAHFDNSDYKITKKN